MLTPKPRSIYVPPEIFNAVVEKLDLKEERINESESLWIRLCSEENVGSLVFLVNGTSYNVTANQLFSPEIGTGSDCYRYLTLAVAEQDSSINPKFILGDPFL